ncbi:MAG TPA: tetratricopeptide repeat protein, partial [Bacteroidia bacterium]|nr:tetratricopeptide repeat protein [Bacteroidia bacterium]
MFNFRILISFFFLINTHDLFSQNFLLVDSLNLELKKFEALKSKSQLGSPDLSDSIKANILYQLSREYWSSNLDTSMMYAKQVLSLSKTIGYEKGIGNALSSMGVIYWYRGDYQEALSYNEEALRIRLESGNKAAIAKSYNNIGLVYDDQGNFLEALRNYLSSLKINEEINDKEGISQAYNNISTVYINQENFPEALKSATSALKIRLETGDKWGLTESYSNIGLIHFEMGNYPEAINNYNEALKLRKEIGDKEGIAISYNNFGDVYKKEGNYAKALQYYLDALEIKKQMGLKKSMADVYLSIGLLYAEQGNIRETIKNETTALALAKEVGAVDYLKNIYAELAKAYANSDNFKNAYRYRILYEQMSDSLFNADKNKAITQLQMQYVFDKKHLADSLKFAQEKRLDEIKLSRQRIFSYGGFGGLLVVIVLLFFVYRNYDKQRIANKQLRDTQQQLIQAEKLASLGGLTAGIAHEIQNPLNFVNNFSDVSVELVEEIRQTKNEEEKNKIFKDLEDNLSKISFHGKRADSIVQNMLQHSRSGTGEKQLTDINKLCDEFAGLAYHGIKAANPGFNCEIIKSFDKNLPRVNLISQDISRVILNLLNNAFYAVKEKSQKSPDFKPSVHLITSSLHHFITIKIKDNGKGISEQDRKKIFEPFFTTKPTGEGTGLGLSISYDIIKSHG